MSLGTCQIDEIELAGAYFLVLAVVGHLGHFEVDGEDGVGARGVFVHKCFADVAVIAALFHDFVDLVYVGADGVGEILDENALLRILFELELGAAFVAQ